MLQAHCSSPKVGILPPAPAADIASLFSTRGEQFLESATEERGNGGSDGRTEGGEERMLEGDASESLLSRLQLVLRRCLRWQNTLRPNTEARGLQQTKGQASSRAATINLLPTAHAELRCSALTNRYCDNDDSVQSSSSETTKSPGCIPILRMRFTCTQIQRPRAQFRPV